MSGFPYPGFSFNEMMRRRDEESLPHELVAEPIVAYRDWSLIPYKGSYVLGAIAYPSAWIPDERGVTRFSCDVTARLPAGREHTEPRLNCTCGIHAYRNEKALRGVYAVRGSVHLWGRVIRHDLGYRAEYARPVKIRLKFVAPHRRLEIKRALEQRYHCRVVPFTWPSFSTLSVVGMGVTMVAGEAASFMGYATATALLFVGESVAAAAILFRMLFRKR